MDFNSYCILKGWGFPLLIQTTFSIWSSADTMIIYACIHPRHAEMIKKRALNWSSKELFVCFETDYVEKNLISKFL